MNCRDGVIRNCPTIFENDSYTCFQLISVDSSAARNNEGLNRLILEKSLGHNGSGCIKCVPMCVVFQADQHKIKL